MKKAFFGTAGLLLVSKGLFVMSGVIFARYLGPVEYGLYGFALSIITLAMLPVTAGLPNLLIREIANFQLKKKWGLLVGVINWSRAYVLLLSISIVVIMYVGLYFSFFDSIVAALLGTALWLIPLNGLLTHQSAVLNGFRQPMLAQLPTQILAPIITLFTLFFFLFFNVKLDANKLVHISIIATTCAFLLSVFLLKRTQGLYIIQAETKYKIKSWHRSLLPFTLMAFISTLNTELASILVGWLVDLESVAYFKVAMQAVALISLGLTAINAVIMPDIARSYKESDINVTQSLLKKSVRISVIVSLPIIFILYFFGELLILTLFGREYLESYSILVILCIGQVVNVFMGSVGAVLYMTNNENSALKILLLSLIINILLLVILIPLYGAKGAACGISISMVVWNILMAYNVKKLTNLRTWLQ
jgi:O-antigen/teichoic acid export membrane protein